MSDGVEGFLYNDPNYGTGKGGALRFLYVLVNTECGVLGRGVSAKTGHCGSSRSGLDEVRLHFSSHRSVLFH